MKEKKWVNLQELRQPGMRRVLEAMRRSYTELELWDDDDPMVALPPRDDHGGQGQPLQ